VARKKPTLNERESVFLNLGEPLGFTVEIIAYGSDDATDTRIWQSLPAEPNSEVDMRTVGEIL
jgi:hypothetical protein